jgi:hypothetical protein
MIQADLGQLWTVQNARQRTILVQLAVDVRGRVFDSKVANPTDENLDERALAAIVSCVMTLEHARCYCLLIAHVGLLPATMTNSPGIR